jgi:surface carbohydrate biosynthesis protein (TIGR04326 family)
VHLTITDDFRSSPHLAGVQTDKHVIVSWNSFDDDDGSSESRVIHLGDLLHDQEATLQRSLYEWLGNLAVRYTASDSPLPPLFPNLHSWWLLSLTEKNYSTTPEFTTLMKLVLLNTICDEHVPTFIEYHGDDRHLESVLREFAISRGSLTSARRASLKHRLRRQTEPLQAAVHFVRLIRVALLNLTRRTDFVTPKTALVGYLIPAASDLRAQSPYWGNLPEYLARSGRLLWLYHRSDEMPLHSARKYCRTKEASAPNEIHRVFDDLVTLGALSRALRSYASWRRARRELTLGAGQLADFHVRLPVDELFVNHMRDSLSGSRAISTIIESHVYDDLVRKHPTNQWLYLWENKPFEHSLVSAIARHSNASSTGYAHSVIRRLDHRYFDETRTRRLSGTSCRPVPTRYAVNSEVARRNLDELGRPNTNVFEVEALRYAPLSLTERHNPNRLIVLGDISRSESERLLRLTVSAVKGQLAPPELWFKPHPGSPSHENIAKDFGFFVTTDSLSAIAPSLLLAIVGVAGAASVDLTLLGVPVITMLDARTPNLSPLSGIPDACFARSTSQLSAFIKMPVLHRLPAASLLHRSEVPQRWLSLLSSTL